MSSSSARPVLRAVVFISGIDNMIFSASRPILSLSSRDMPGNVATLIVNDPSLNDGRNPLPSVKKHAIAPATVMPVIISIFLRLPSAESNDLQYN